MVLYFAKRFNEATELVLEKLWYKMNENIELYIRFEVYESPEDLRIELAKYTTFSKNYSNDISNVGVNFPNIICLIKTEQHYDLLKQIIDVDDVQSMMKKRKKVILIARKGRYFFHVNIRTYRKPKMPRNDKKF